MAMQETAVALHCGFGVWGLAGTRVLQEEDPPLQLPPPPQIHRQW